MAFSAKPGKRSMVKQPKKAYMHHLLAGEMLHECDCCDKEVWKRTCNDLDMIVALFQEAPNCQPEFLVSPILLRDTSR